MRRVASPPRPGWRDALRADGLDWEGAGPAWDENAHWAFTEAEIETLYEAANELYAMALDVVGHSVDARLWPLLGIDERAGAAVEASWRDRDAELSLTTRLEIAWAGEGQGDGQPKLLGFNADTPDGLLEAALVQWRWKEALHRHADQFNGLHEALVARLAAGAAGLARRFGAVPTLYATARPDDPAAVGQMRYLVRLAAEAGLAAEFIALPDIGYDHADGRFVDLAEREMRFIAKHHPWQWLLLDPFGRQLLDAVRRDRVEVVEPAWRMLLGNKALLALLWERYPHHPFLAEAHRDPRAFLPGTAVTAKPRFGLGGAGVRQGTIDAGRFTATTGARSADFGAEGDVFQATVPLAFAGGRVAALDVWMVGDEALGMGMRESPDPIIGRDAAFVPHIFT